MRDGEILRATDLTKAFGPEAARIEVLRGVSLVLSRGEMVAIAGASGSGKSTLLHILGGLMHPNSGCVELAGRDVYRLSEGERARMRNQSVGFVYQMHHLLPEFSAVENVTLPALIAGRREARARRRALELLDALAIAHRAEHKPGELSGGEQQRVAVARALVNEPAVVLADEPSGNLDHESSEALHELLQRLALEHGQALLIATHSKALAQKSHRTLWLDDGSLTSMQAVEERI